MDQKTMNLTNIIRTRRSVRNYLSKPVEDDKLSEIIEVARLAPSSCNSQPWRFVVVKDRDIKDQIVSKGLGGVLSNAWTETAPVIIVACAKRSLIPHRVAPAIKSPDLCLLDMGAAIEHLILKATELELGTCWIGWFKAKPIHKILNIPKSITIIALIAVGYPAEEDIQTERVIDRLDTEEILSYNRWNW